MTAGVFGAVYSLVGILGFFGSLTPDGNLLGLFPVSTPLNVVHLLIGLTGIGVFFAAPAMGRSWAQAIGALLALLAVVGIVVSNPMGVVPIGGLNIILHAASAAVMLYVGFAGESRQSATA
jgi:hypothetical protein